jgi:hypothetical protein
MGSWAPETRANSPGKFIPRNADSTFCYKGNFGVQKQSHLVRDSGAAYFSACRISSLYTSYYKNTKYQVFARILRSTRIMPPMDVIQHFFQITCQISTISTFNYNTTFHSWGMYNIITEVYELHITGYTTIICCILGWKRTNKLSIFRRWYCIFDNLSRFFTIWYFDSDFLFRR